MRADIPPPYVFWRAECRRRTLVGLSAVQSILQPAKESLMKPANQRLRRSLLRLSRFAARGTRSTLALGGGGARGIAHLGVVEVLRSLGIRIERIVGVSIGSLAGALCALDEDIGHVQERLAGLLTSEAFQRQQSKMFATAPTSDEPGTSGLFAWWEQFSRFLGARRRMLDLLNRPSLLPSEFMLNIVTELLPDIDLRDLRIPLTVVALDLCSGKQVKLTRGSLRSAVVASTAIPGVFPPVDIDGKQLVDIGIIDALPVSVAVDYGSDLTIAVDVGSDVVAAPPVQTAKDVFLRVSDVTERHVRQYTRGMSDLIIRPQVSGVPWYEFSRPEKLFESGRHAAREALKQYFSLDKADGVQSRSVAST